MYIYIYIYDSQIVHHNPCFNLFILHSNPFDNQGSQINKKKRRKNMYIYIYIYTYVPSLITVFKNVENF